MSKILIVEDDQALADVLRGVLEKLNYTIIHALSAEDGLSLAAESQPDAILLDINLPGMTGLEALAGFTERSDKPIIVMTSHADKDKRTDAMLLGAKELIGKPIDHKLLEETLKKLL